MIAPLLSQLTANYSDLISDNGFPEICIQQPHETNDEYLWFISWLILSFGKDRKYEYVAKMFDFNVDQIRSLVSVSRRNSWYKRAREFDSFRQVVVFQQISRMQTQSPLQAWETLNTIMNDSKVKAEVRVRAAEAILDRSGYPIEKTLRYEDLTKRAELPASAKQTGQLLIELEREVNERIQDTNRRATPLMIGGASQDDNDEFPAES